MENWQVLLLIALVFAVVWGNIALLKYSAKFNFKNINQDPVEKAKNNLKQQKKDSE